MLTFRTEIPFDSDHYDADTIEGALNEERQRDLADIMDDVRVCIELGEYTMTRSLTSLMTHEESHATS